MQWVTSAFWYRGTKVEKLFGPLEAPPHTHTHTHCDPSHGCWHIQIKHKNVNVLVAADEKSADQHSHDTLPGFTAVQVQTDGPARPAPPYPPRPQSHNSCQPTQRIPPPPAASHSKVRVNNTHFSALQQHTSCFLLLLQVMSHDLAPMTTLNTHTPNFTHTHTPIEVPFCQVHWCARWSATSAES